MHDQYFNGLKMFFILYLSSFHIDLIMCMKTSQIFIRTWMNHFDVFTFQLLWWVPGARLCEIREYLPTDCDVRRGTYPRILSFHGTSAPTTRSPNLSTERWKCLIVFTICPQRVWFHFSINGLNVAHISRVKLSHKGTND